MAYSLRSTATRARRLRGAGIWARALQREGLPTTVGVGVRQSLNASGQFLGPGEAVWGQAASVPRATSRAATTRKRRLARGSGIGGGASGWGADSTASCGTVTQPSRIATIVASVRDSTPSLAKMLRRWTLTVFGLMNSSRAIWLLLAPVATSRKISNSRSLSGSFAPFISRGSFIVY